MVYAHQVNLN